MREFLWSSNKELIFIWIVLMLYGLYKYHRKTHFRDVAIVHFVFSVILIYWYRYTNATILFGIELGLLLYVFYKYHRKTGDLGVSIGHCIFSIVSIYLYGYAAIAALFGIEYLLLLPFMPFGIATIVRWYELYPLVFVLGIIVTFSILTLIYYIFVKKCALKLQYAILATLLSTIFICGSGSFLYVLSWNIF